MTWKEAIEDLCCSVLAQPNRQSLVCIFVIVGQDVSGPSRMASVTRILALPLSQSCETATSAVSIASALSWPKRASVLQPFHKRVPTPYSVVQS